MPAAIQPLIDALERFDVVSDDERLALEQLPVHQRTFEAGTDIVRQGARPSQSCLVVEGIAARAQFLEDGRRQLTALHIAGDFVDLHSLLLKVMDHSVVAMSDCKVALINHDALKQCFDSHRHLARLFWLSTLVDAAIQRAWITCMGRRNAATHFAHLICELFVRLESRGLTRGNSFHFNATQSELGDMLGLSTVHVNRTLQELRRLRLVSWADGVVTIQDFGQLAAMADFDPTHLNLWSEPR